MPEPKRINWHRWFGVGLTDRFAGTAWRVELEKELALKSQRLDVVVIERGNAEQGAGATRPELPDGLDNLRAHNLLTYKSHQESLDAWALDELIGHYVNYRKLLADRRPGDGDPAEGDPAPDINEQPSGLASTGEFQLYAVATRKPVKLLRGLMSGAVQPTEYPGVHDLQWGSKQVRLIVLDAVAETPRNALWQLFSARVERVRRGLSTYQGRTKAAHELLFRLYSTHRFGLAAMTYTVEDFVRETHEEIIANLTPEECVEIVKKMSPEQRLQGLAPEQRLQGLAPEQRLQGLAPEERLQGLPPEQRLQGLPPEERLRGLPPETLLRSLDPDQLKTLDPEERDTLRRLLRKLN